MRPIQPDQVPEVARFLHEHLNSKVSTATWAAAILPTWPGESPNHGFMLMQHDQIIGVHLAFYSQRLINGQQERFCNLGAWCVRDGYRSQGLRLLRALLSQRDYNFTDLSPSGNVVELNRRLKFTDIDTETVLVPNLPRRPGFGGIRVIRDHRIIEDVLTAPELSIFQDHQGALAARHLLVVEGDEHCYLIYRRDRRKRLPLFASIIYASNPPLLHRAIPAVVSDILIHDRLPATLVEVRSIGRPVRALRLRTSRAKMFKSRHLTQEQVDYLYSELTCVPW
ncbi:hypothetical protein GCM10009841_26270 [Microlunatus panaciterrae]